MICKYTGFFLMAMNFMNTKESQKGKFKKNFAGEKYCYIFAAS
jgi:hypothetical protein